MAEPAALAVHRCRFVDFEPSPITALSFPPLPLPSLGKEKASTVTKLPRFGVLAVGRANGNIDLCEWTGLKHQFQSSQAWVTQKTLCGPYPSKVDSLAFTIRYPDTLKPDDVPSVPDLRLFSSGGGSDLLEWDLNLGAFRRSISSQGGSIWSIAANPGSTILALGCEDGSVCILSLMHDTLTHHRRFDRVKCRMLSIAWGPPQPRQRHESHNDDSSDEEDDEAEWVDSWLVTGCSDSSLRLWDVSTGRVIDRMGTDKMKGERTLVWAVSVLGDGTIVSGDSLGMVKFWDSKTCTQLQSFQSHGADVLCLTISPDGAAVYTSGVDQKVFMFSLVKGSISASSSHTPTRWVPSTSRRLHSHDVRALAIWPPYSALPSSHKRQFPIDVAPVLASGGLDMSVVLTPAAPPSSTVVKIINPLCTSADSTLENSYHRRLAYTSGPSSTHGVILARQAGLIMCLRNAGLTLWIIHRKHSHPKDDSEIGTAEADDPSGWEKVLDMEFNVHTNLVAGAISDDGRWLAVSDLYETKLFAIHAEQNEYKPERVRNFTNVLQSSLPSSQKSTGSVALSFTPDSSKLVMSSATSSHVLLVDLEPGVESPRVLRCFDQHRIAHVGQGTRVLKGRKGKAVEDLEEQEESSSSESEDDSEPIFASILRLAISADGQWLATSDTRCRTHIFNLDSIQYHCTLPSFALPVHAMAFDPCKPGVLIMAFPDNSIQIYDVESRQFHPWSRNLSQSLPKRFTQAHDPIIGLVFDPAEKESNSGAVRHVIFWGSTWIAKVKLGHSDAGLRESKKRRRNNKSMGSSGDQSSDSCKIITHYRPLLCVDFLAPRELVVVERPLVDVLAKLPPAYFKAKYGAT